MINLFQEGKSVAQPPVSPISEKPTSDTEYFPVGPAQRWLLTYFEPPYQWGGYTRFRYHQPLDGEAFRQSLQQLVERHPSLHTIFVQKEGYKYPNRTLLVKQGIFE